jgi:ABC-type glycerol-3-phosphate transport system permease component
MIQFTKPQARLVSNISVSIVMTVVMTGGMLLVHSGYGVNFFKLWLNDFLVGCCIAVPTGLLIVPIISKWVDLHTDNKDVS